MKYRNFYGHICLPVLVVARARVAIFCWKFWHFCWVVFDRILSCVSSILLFGVIQAPLRTPWFSQGTEGQAVFGYPVVEPLPHRHKCSYQANLHRFERFR